MRSPLGAYIPGRSVLHRMRPGTKLLGLFVFATAAVALRSMPSTAVALVVAVTLALVSGLRGSDFGRIARGFAFIALPLLLFAVLNGASAAEQDREGFLPATEEAWQTGLERGFSVVGTLFALILAASAVTASTAIADTIDTVTWALRPLRRIGVDADRVALAFSLVLTAIPTVLSLAAETRAAAKARGLERSPRAYLVPLVLRTVAHAQATGAALHARGVGDDEDPDAPRGEGSSRRADT